ncbi:hypothetical protein ARMGADRAFT_1047807 [Armillaria gallica]|uniref:Uncharacterized protein n=1 Tax=Armillaria gallica TaxID=47427 RepID=A0A2H3CUU0_ARMGA|nr:hypothetical protein ARMGADRAFT_1047807 [Armillaria gallica]
MLVVFATWAPNLVHHYATHLHDLLIHNATLIMNWTHSIFTAATFNFGPRTLCFCHTNSGNLPFGWCAITVLGRFDYHRGGHLVLWDLKLVIDFPPGQQEQRYSFTQYTMGGLFRWYWKSLSAKEQLAAKQMQEERWCMGLGMFSTLEDLHCRAMAT